MANQINQMEEKNNEHYEVLHISKLVEEPMKEVASENIGLGTGWACGSIPIIGIIYSLSNMAKGRRRIAFQALAVAGINIIAFIFLIVTYASADPYSTEVNLMNYIVLFWFIWLFLPLISTFILRELNSGKPLETTTVEEPPSTKERIITCPECKQSEAIPENKLLGVSLYTKFDAKVKSKFGFQKLSLRCRNCNNEFTLDPFEPLN